MSLDPMFSGEVQFVTFADSSKGGPRITVRLHDRDELEKFIGKEGKRLACVLVEIGDDEQAVQPLPKERPAKLAMDAALVCKNPEFWEYARRDGYPATEDGAAQLVRAYCGVGSRSDLNTNPEAARRFAMLMSHFARYRSP